jgi:hypothetical protein
MTDRTNQPVNVSAETKEQADQFITTIGAMFETVEMLAGADRPMNEGEWLILANQFKKLVEMKTRTITTVIYMEAERTHTRGRVLQAKKPLTKAEKLKDKDYMCCPKCKKVMKIRSYHEKHKLAGICSHIVAVGNVVSHNKGVEKSAVKRVKISDKERTIYEEQMDVLYKKVDGRRLKYVERENVPRSARSLAYLSLLIADTLTFPKIDAMGKYKIVGDVLDIHRNIVRKVEYEIDALSGGLVYERTAEGKWKVMERKIQIKRKVKPTIKIGAKKPVADVLSEREQTTRC